jgi:hypothetical protein
VRESCVLGKSIWFSEKVVLSITPFGFERKLCSQDLHLVLRESSVLNNSIRVREKVVFSRTPFGFERKLCSPSLHFGLRERTVPINNLFWSGTKIYANPVTEDIPS